MRNEREKAKEAHQVKLLRSGGLLFGSCDKQLSRGADKNPFSVHNVFLIDFFRNVKNISSKFSKIKKRKRIVQGQDTLNFQSSTVLIIPQI